jgi:hypothetical protein
VVPHNNLAAAAAAAAAAALGLGRTKEGATLLMMLVLTAPDDGHLESQGLATQ